MSNAIRYDSLLVRHLAAELDALLAGRVLRALRLERASRRATLLLRRGVLVWDLHPASGAVRWLERGPPPGAAGALLVEPARGTRVARVLAPPDERVLRIELEAPTAAEPDGAEDARRAGAPACIVVELLTNQWNLLALDAQERILAVLRPRERGRRALRAGATYAPPPPTGRAGVGAPLGREEWRELLGAVPPGERSRALLARVAYTSPLNAAAILGDAGGPGADAEALDAAYDRYRAVVGATSADPHLLRAGGAAQPYPVPLPGVEGERLPSLLAALAAAGGAAAPEAAPAIPHAALERLRGRIEALERRAARMQEELERAGPRAVELRRAADLLLAQLQRVEKGMAEAELSDFAGGTVRVSLDPALTPVENARRLYDMARKRERAAAQLPARIRATQAERDRLAALLGRAQAGAAGLAEVEEAAGAVAAAGALRGAPHRLPPYRRYRTSGGLEVRVGRNRRANDELTFHHSSPDDVWLHARAAAGSHVILRWADPDANPPARDLVEAAVLAALHSRARTSGTVAVDWTRRKHVRKPRKAPPGLVVPERVRTLFVEPDADAEKRLRLPGSDGE